VGGVHVVHEAHAAPVSALRKVWVSTKRSAAAKELGGLLESKRHEVRAVHAARAVHGFARRLAD